MVPIPLLKNQPGGGLQDKIDPNFEKELRSNNPNTPLIDSMIRMGYLRRL